MNEAESCEGATLHCVCPKLIMLTIFRGPSGVGEGSTGRSTMKYHKTEAGSTKFWLLCVEKGWNWSVVCHRRFWRSRTKLQIWPRGNLLEWGAVVICLGARINKKQQNPVMATTNGPWWCWLCDVMGLGGWVWEIINRGRFDLVLVWGERVYVA